MSGAGNDFVVIDNRSNCIAEPHKLARYVCNRRFGIGADGLLLVENSQQSHFTMKYYNADGSDGGMCGNGGRCIARFAHLIGIVKPKEFTFDALGHVYGASIEADGTVKLRMKDPTGFRFNQILDVNGESIKTHFVDTGSPHCIIFLNENRSVGDNLDKVDVWGLGNTIRYMTDVFPKGTNVNFVSLKDSNTIEIRTYERGVEDETLACGTGSLGSAIISSVIYKIESPVKVTVRSGEILEIGFQKKSETEFSTVTLSGSAKVVFEGQIED